MSSKPFITVEEFYKTGAIEYEKFGKNSYAWNYIHQPVFEKYLQNLYSPQLKVLEVGSGAGKVVNYLLKVGNREQNITGIDISPEMVALSRKQYPQINFIEGNARDITFPKNSFDLVISSMVFHHTDDTELSEIFKNIFAWLKKGGIFFYLTSHPVNVIEEQMDKYFQQGWLNRKTPWGAVMPSYHRTVSDFINITIKAGFQIYAVDEPEVSEAGKIDPIMYKKQQEGPSRLVVVAKK